MRAVINSMHMVILKTLALQLGNLTSFSKMLLSKIPTNMFIPSNMFIQFSSKFPANMFIPSNMIIRLSTFFLPTCLFHPTRLFGTLEYGDS